MTRLSFLPLKVKSAIWKHSPSRSLHYRFKTAAHELQYEYERKNADLCKGKKRVFDVNGRKIRAVEIDRVGYKVLESRGSILIEFNHTYRHGRKIHILIQDLKSMVFPEAKFYCIEVYRMDREDKGKQLYEYRDLEGKLLHVGPESNLLICDSNGNPIPTTREEIAAEKYQ